MHNILQMDRSVNPVSENSIEEPNYQERTIGFQIKRFSFCVC